MRKAPSFTSWLMVTGRITVDARLLSDADLGLGNAGRLFCAHDHHWFGAICSRLGLSDAEAAAQWNTLCKITALTGAAARTVTDDDFTAARTATTAAYAHRRQPSSGRTMAANFHRLQLTLFHAGRLTTLRRPAPHPPASVTGWATVAPGFAESARRYLEQVTVSLRASTVKHIEHDLRQFGIWLADTHPEVTSCADLRREHIEAFKTWLATHPTPATGKPLNRVSIKNALINLHCFFTRITEWGYPNPPTRPLLFPGDLPIIDKPLPRFLDDAAAAKLLRATRADPDPLSRLIVELLARTGIRRGELLALTVDAVVQIGSAYWLRIPIGKLHNDRYIPLHPQLKELLDDWIIHHRPTGLRTNRLLLEHNRPISHHRVTKALRRAADTAGIGTVTAHQLRHTLATQAVNRGMSLDAIAALLGQNPCHDQDLRAHRRQDRRRRVLRRHREGRSTLRSAPPIRQRRRGSRNAQAPQRDAPAHARQRLLRPTRRDGLPLRIHLRIMQLLRHHHRVPPHPATQRDDAARKGQLGRQRIFDNILNRLDTDAS